MSDLHHALRSLRRAPGFAAVTVLTLALGIGVNTRLFTLVDALFLQPLPVASPRELVMVMQRGDLLNVPYGHSYSDYVDFRQGMTAFSGLAAFMLTPVHLSAPEQTPERAGHADGAFGRRPVVAGPARPGCVAPDGSRPPRLQRPHHGAAPPRERVRPHAPAHGGDDGRHRGTARGCSSPSWASTRSSPTRRAGACTRSACAWPWARGPATCAAWWCGEACGSP